MRRDHPLASPWLSASLGLVLVLVAAAAIVLPGLLQRSGALESPALSPTASVALPSVSASTGPSVEPTFVRPTPSPQPTFLSYPVRFGDTLTSIATQFRTTARSIAWWNRGTYPTLDPESSAYAPNHIVPGWILVLLPGITVDENNPPTPSPAPSLSPTASPRPSSSPSSSPSAGTAATVITNGSRDTVGIALTFDMGGRLDPAVQIVQWLIDHQVHATLFPTGLAGSTTTLGRAALTLAAAHPDLFDIGNHSWDHPDFTSLTAAQMTDQLSRCETAIRPIVGQTTKPWFRPPYGAWTSAVRTAVGRAGWRYLVMWDVDTIDWKPTSDGGPTTTDIVAKVAAKAQGGSIVLMHLGGWHTLEALPGILAATAAKGLTPITLGEMFDR
jgi:peptidoglycan/xylan/chitin deacetylase (PgdA/CDA1 family)